MTTIAVSTIQMAQDYAERSNLAYDHKPYIGGGEFICYDDAGEVIQVIKYCSSNAEIINRVNDKLFENLFALPFSSDLVKLRGHVG
jgi:hypothetical protein